MQKEQLFFIQLLDQSAAYSEMNTGTDLEELKKVFLAFWEANLVAFQEKLESHLKNVNRFAGKKEVEERRMTTLLKSQRKLQQNYFSIRKAFNDLKECAFERVDDFVDLRII